MLQVKGYKVELQPNRKQVALLLQSTAVHRNAFNYALGKCKEYHKEHGRYPKLKEIHDINKDFTLLKTQESYDWYNEASKCCHQLAIFDLKNAFERFYKSQSKPPKFKSIFRSEKKFHFDNVSIKVSRHTIKIPKVGYIKFKEFGRIPYKDVKFNNFTVSLSGNRWYLSVSVEQNKDIKVNNKELPVLGLDLGIKDLIVCSDGKVYNIPEATKIKIEKHKIRHIRYQRKLSRQVKGSKRRNKTSKLMAVNYKKICNLKSDAIHKITTDIAKRSPKVIVAEDLAIINLLKNHRLANSISDCSFGEILRQLKYKSYLVGGEFYQVNRFYPSSKTCSNCGNIKHNLKLSDRVYRCDNCGLEINRDLNAAFNIKSCYISNVRSVGSEQRLKVA